MTRQDIMTVEDISNVLGISKNTIQRRSWRKQTGCPLRKIGKRLYSQTVDFQKWLRGNG